MPRPHAPSKKRKGTTPQHQEQLLRRADPAPAMGPLLRAILTVTALGFGLSLTLSVASWFPVDLSWTEPARTALILGLVPGWIALQIAIGRFRKSRGAAGTVLPRFPWRAFSAPAPRLMRQGLVAVVLYAIFAFVEPNAAHGNQRLSGDGLLRANLSFPLALYATLLVGLVAQHRRSTTTSR